MPEQTKNIGKVWNRKRQIIVIILANIYRAISYHVITPIGNIPKEFSRESPQTIKNIL